MILFPYRAQIKLHKTPVVTIGVALVCLVIYFGQDRNERAVAQHAASVCAGLAAEGQTGVTAEGYGSGRHRVTCDTRCCTYTAILTM